jgi:hypothetical protein
MRFASLILILSFILAPVWISIGSAFQAPAQPQPPTTDKLPPSAIEKPDRSDPLFQEFIKEIAKSGPMLRDPAHSEHHGFPPSHTPGPNHGPLSPEQAEEMRWQSIEQLLRNARDIRSQAELIRSLGQGEQAGRLIQLADELRRTAIQIAPPPQPLNSP